MEERDYFKKQVNLLGKVLAKLVADLMGIKNANNTGGLAITNQFLKNELELDLGSLIDIPTTELVDFLKTKKQLNTDNLEQLAEALMLNLEGIAEVEIGKKDQINLLEKCLIIYEYVTANDTTFSMERRGKIQKIKLLISQ